MNILYDLNKLSNFGIDNSKITDDGNIAQMLFQSYNNMTDIELAKILIKTMTNKEIRSQLLRYELKFYEQQHRFELSLDEFKREVFHILNRYHHKAGGFKIDDRIWMCHDHTSKRYKIHSNEIVFENTISSDYIDDSECYKYLQLLIKRLNTLSTNIRVTFHTHHAPRDQMYYLLIKCSHKYLKN